MVLYSDIKIEHGEYQLITKGFLVVWSLLILADLDWSALLCSAMIWNLLLVWFCLVWSGLVWSMLSWSVLLYFFACLVLVWSGMS